MSIKEWFKSKPYWIKGGIIGFLIGIIMSLNMMFMGLGGEIIYNISLGFILDSLPLSEGAGWLMGIFFFVIVYFLYGILIGLLIKKVRSK